MKFFLLCAVMCLNLQKTERSFSQLQRIKYKIAQYAILYSVLYMLCCDTLGFFSENTRADHKLS